MTEQWRPVVGYEGLYEVSDQGRIWSARLVRPGEGRGGFRKLTPAPYQGGYLVVSLFRDSRLVTRLVHKLVMEAFVGPCPEGMEVRHLDGDPLNARLGNLAYGSSSENKHDQVSHGRHYAKNRTHCPSGHPYDEENTYVLPSRPNARYCRACQRARKRAA